MQNKFLFRLSVVAVGLALMVLVLGAYVRLSHAGLGCPDWPGCYGLLDVPQTLAEIEDANKTFPQRPVEKAKAWKEMGHRYFAGVLGLLIAFIAIFAWLKRRSGVPVLLPSSVLALVIFQALLGMWTVTLLLKPLVVTAHLLGGISTLALLWCLVLQHSGWRQSALIEWQAVQGIKRFALLCLAVLFLQIALGGWTSSNYAALACYGFPDCNQQWWPATDFSEAFILWRGLGINYEGGVLDHPARVAIHLSHRIGALILTVLLLILSVKILRHKNLQQVKPVVWVLGLLLLIQISLGVANVTQGLPLFIATAHNGVAALLVLALLSIIYLLMPNKSSIA